MKGYIYKIVNKINQKFYVGQTVNFRSRKSHHLGELRRGVHQNPFLQRSFKAYGEENFDFEVIEEYTFPEDYSKDYIREYLASREIYFMWTLKPEYNSNYNITESCIGIKMTEETVEKMRKALTGRKLSKEHKKKVSEGLIKCFEERGYSHTEEQKNKISKSKKGIKKTSEHIEKHRQALLGGNHTEEHKKKISESLKGREFTEAHKEALSEGIRKAIEERGYTVSEETRKKMSEVKKGKRLPEKAYERSMEILTGSKFSENRLEKHREIITELHKNPFDCFMVDGTFIGTFDTQAQAGRELGMKGSLIGRVLREERKSTKGYIFKYKEVDNG